MESGKPEGSGTGELGPGTGKEWFVVGIIQTMLYEKSRLSHPMLN
jgi:hypothetical protein